jgi:methylated-DNA-[protein]-cysteine S-methyltransferase
MATITQKRKDVRTLTSSKSSSKPSSVSKVRRSTANDANPLSPPAITTTHVPKSMHPQIALIASSQRTTFEKRVWAALCQIPAGHYTTYALLSSFLGSSPRAVGNALRRNPFAPEVPCHRVVATGRTLGGFKGQWPKSGEGITLDEKRGLLRGEGVRFDDKGKVLGTPWVGFR